MIADKPTQILQIPQWAKPNIQNIVSTVDLDCTLDLKQIAWKGRNTQYNPNKFAAVVMRLRQPKTTALVFRSGKMVVTGAKSQQQSNTASRKYAKIIQKIGFPVNFKKFDIQNIVASCDVKFPINLQQLLHKHRKMARYQPQMFPGLVFKMQNPKIVFLIFVSGKIVLTGAKDRSIINQSFKLIYKIVYDCQKKIVSSDKLNQ